jgi:hypothetical protein
MAAKIHNTATATQQGAPLPATRNKNRHFESLTLTTLTGRVSSVLVDGHTMPSIVAVNPAASTKVQKLMDTLFGVTRGCNMLLRIDPTKIEIPTGQRESSGFRLTNYLDTPTLLLDTRVEKKNESTLAKSTRSPKTSRYTFEMFWKGVFTDKTAETAVPSLWMDGAEGIMGA